MNTVNTCIHPELLPILDLAPNPEVYPISPAHIQSAVAVPDHLTLNIVCMTLSHRIHRMRSDTVRRDLAEKLYRYRGNVLISLNEDIGVESRRKGDVLFAGIISFLLAEIQFGPLSNWRCHLDGLRDLIRLRGGCQEMSMRKGMGPSLHCYLLYVFKVKPSDCIRETTANKISAGPSWATPLRQHQNLRLPHGDMPKLSLFLTFAAPTQIPAEHVHRPCSPRLSRSTASAHVLQAPNRPQEMAWLTRDTKSSLASSTSAVRIGWLPNHLSQVATGCFFPRSKSVQYRFTASSRCKASRPFRKLSRWQTLPIRVHGDSGSCCPKHSRPRLQDCQFYGRWWCLG
jgi:hypothetical protein